MRASESYIYSLSFPVRGAWSMHGYLYLSLPTPSCMCSSKHTAQNPFFLCILMSFIHPYPLIPHISCPHHYLLFWNTPHTHLLFLSHPFVAANLTSRHHPPRPSEHSHQPPWRLRLLVAAEPPPRLLSPSCRWWWSLSLRMVFGWRSKLEEDEVLGLGLRWVFEPAPVSFGFGLGLVHQAQVCDQVSPLGLPIAWMWTWVWSQAQGLWTSFPLSPFTLMKGPLFCSPILSWPMPIPSPYPPQISPFVFNLHDLSS